MSERPQVRAQPALIVSEQNRYDYVCVVMVDPNTRTFIVDGDLCQVRKGTKQEVVTRLSNYLRGMGYNVVVARQ